VAAQIRDHASGPGLTVAASYHATRDIVAEACRAAEPLGLPVSAWAVILHRDDLSARGPDGQENCFGDRYPGRLCPAPRPQPASRAPRLPSPATRRFVCQALRLTSQSCLVKLAMNVIRRNAHG
jgi:hypothetical protein